MSSITNYIIINGELFERDKAVVSISNRAFKYGDALFETIRLIDGNLCLFDLHLERLLYGASLLGFRLEDDFELKMSESIVKLLYKNGITGDARLRLQLFRNDGGLYTPTTNRTSYLMEVLSLESKGYQLNPKGLDVDLFEDYKKQQNKFSQLKTTNCLPLIVASLYKKQNVLDECLLLDQKRDLSEAISSNVFVVFKEGIHTPYLESGCLAGVMRKHLIKLISKQGIDLFVGPVSIAMLESAEEVFLTNAVSGIQWVGSFRGKTYSNKMAKYLVELLNGFPA